MTQEFLILYKPNVRIPFSSALEEVTGVLDSSGFKLSTSMSGSPVYNGTAWISKIDQVAIHFEFSDMNTLDSILIQNETYNDRNLLIKSYKRKQTWLEPGAGIPHAGICAEAAE